MWLEFVADFQWTPPEQKQVRIAFRKGHRYFVRKACGAAALGANKAVKFKPARPEGDAK